MGFGIYVHGWSKSEREREKQTEKGGKLCGRCSAVNNKLGDGRRHHADLVQL